MAKNEWNFHISPQGAMRKKTIERYIKIYNLYILGHCNQEKIADEVGVCRRTVETALKWVAEERVNIPNETFLRLEIEAIRERKRRLQESLDRMEKIVNWNAAIAYEKELRANDELEMKLRGLLENAKPQPRIPIELLNTFVDTLAKIFNEINELDTAEKRRKAFAERVSKLSWSEIRKPDRLIGR